MTHPDLPPHHPSGPAPPPLLHGEQVAKTYTRRRSRWRRPHPQDTQWAINHVSIAVRPAEVAGIVGQSGSGKSTLAACLAGLTPIDAGTVFFNGASVATAGRTAALPRVDGVQVIYQDPYASLNPRRTVGSVLAEILSVHRLTNRRQVPYRCAELLDQVGLPDRVLGQRPQALSGGMRQRVAIARALAFTPRVLVADEVVSALDASVQAQVLNLLADLRDHTKVAILFVTHDLSVVNQLCDTVSVMHRGQIVETGPTETVLRHPQDPYTQQLLDAVPRLTPPLPPDRSGTRR